MYALSIHHINFQESTKVVLEAPVPTTATEDVATIPVPLPPTLVLNPGEWVVVWQDSPYIILQVRTRFMGDIRHYKLDDGIAYLKTHVHIFAGQTLESFVGKLLAKYRFNMYAPADILSQLDLEEFSQSPVEALSVQGAFRLFLLKTYLEGANGVCIQSPEDIDDLGQLLANLRGMVLKARFTPPAVAVIDSLGLIDLTLLADRLLKADEHGVLRPLRLAF